MGITELLNVGRSPPTCIVQTSRQRCPAGSFSRSQLTRLFHGIIFATERNIEGKAGLVVFGRSQKGSLALIDLVSFESLAQAPARPISQRSWQLLADKRIASMQASQDGKHIAAVNESGPVWLYRVRSTGDGMTQRLEGIASAEVVSSRAVPLNGETALALSVDFSELRLLARRGRKLVQVEAVKLSAPALDLRVDVSSSAHFLLGDGSVSRVTVEADRLVLRQISAPSKLSGLFALAANLQIIVAADGKLLTSAHGRSKPLAAVDSPRLLSPGPDSQLAVGALASKGVQLTRRSLFRRRTRYAEHSQLGRVAVLVGHRAAQADRRRRLAGLAPDVARPHCVAMTFSCATVSGGSRKAMPLLSIREACMLNAV